MTATITNPGVYSTLGIIAAAGVAVSLGAIRPIRDAGERLGDRIAARLGLGR
jgi:hypothetical protein